MQKPNATSRRVFRWALLLVLLGACLVPTRRALAQIDPFKAPYLIYQSGQIAGVIYVPDRASRELYIEHWVLFPNYVYPSARSGASISIVPNPAVHLANEQQFFRWTPFGPGYRYVEVTAHDTTALPGR